MSQEIIDRIFRRRRRSFAADVYPPALGEEIAEGGEGGADSILKSLVDAKGDLIVGSGPDTPAKLTVGANGTVLTADSAQATGMAWAEAAGGGLVFPEQWAIESEFLVIPEGDGIIVGDENGDPAQFTKIESSFLTLQGDGMSVADYATGALIFRATSSDWFQISRSAGGASFRVLADGSVLILNLPTADPVVAGQLWNDGGTLKVSAG